MADRFDIGFYCTRLGPAYITISSNTSYGAAASAKSEIVRLFRAADKQRQKPSGNSGGVQRRKGAARISYATARSTCSQSDAGRDTGFSCKNNICNNGKRKTT
jgi:hypothetical protein